MSISNLSGIPKFTSVLPESQYKKDKEAEALKKAEEAKKKEEQEKQKAEQAKKAKENELSMLEMQLQASKEQSEGMEKSFDTMGKCLLIAMRITRGDIVPMKDMKFLMDNDPELYKQSILLRQPNDDPEKHKSVLEDEEESTENADSSGSEPSDTSSGSSPAPQVQAAASVSAPVSAPTSEGSATGE